MESLILHMAQSNRDPTQVPKQIQTQKDLSVGLTQSMFFTGVLGQTGFFGLAYRSLY